MHAIQRLALTDEVGHNDQTDATMTSGLLRTVDCVHDVTVLKIVEIAVSFYGQPNDIYSLEQ